MNIESMGEQEGFSLLEIGFDIHFIEFGLDMILGEDLNKIGLFRRLFGSDWFKSVSKSKLIIFTPLPLRDKDVEAAISQVLGLGMPLAPITDNGNLLSLQMVEVGILIIIDFHERLPIKNKFSNPPTPLC
jgi:hypothetical protein